MGDSDQSKTGVYCIRNLVNGKFYVGSAAKSFRSRWNAHRCYLRNNTHANRHLQSAWYLYGEKSFEFSILLVCDPVDCVHHEQVFIDKLNAVSVGYNKSPTAGNCRGIKRDGPMAESTRIKIGNAHRGKPKSAEHRKKLADAKLGRKRGPQAPEHRKAIGDGQRGKVIPFEQRIKISKSLTGQVQSREAIRKRAITAIGRKRSEESRARMSAAQKGRTATPESRENMRLAHIGKTLPIEQRNKISESLKGRIISNQHQENIRIGKAKNKLSLASTFDEVLQVQ